MPPARDQLRFFVDESTLGIGKVLTIARRDVVHVGHPAFPEVDYGALDEEWIPTIGEMGLAVIARDRRFRTKPVELELMHEHGLRVFWLAGRRDRSTWEYLNRLVRRWGDIENALETKGPGPWFSAVHDSKLSDYPL